MIHSPEGGCVLDHPDGAERALDALEQLTVLTAALEGLGPVAQRAVRHRIRRTAREGRR
ncbi:hypothetical protein [Streptomyces sp. NPDC059909]|uniref:hypothetical protein n=1 Tax=Streptomyces sp. NPDC059909 TaxID=3346998 RepID=UPI003660A36C